MESGWNTGKYTRSSYFIESLKGTSITQLISNETCFFTSTNQTSNSISIFDRSTCKLKTSMQNEGIINAFSLVQNDKKIVGASNKLVKIWDAEKGELICSMEGHTGEISCLFANGIFFTFIFYSSFSSLLILGMIKEFFLISFFFFWSRYPSFISTFLCF